MKHAKRVPGIKRRQFIKASLATGAAFALGGGLAAPAIGQSVKTLRFGHMLPNTQTQSRAIQMFADELGKMSSGKIKVEIFPSSQLGSITEMMQSVQAGALTMSMAVPAWYSTFAKPLDAFTLPYLVASVERRNPHIEVLSHIQIEALRRRRAGQGDADKLTRIVFTTIGGIAAGLQTAG